MAEDFDVEAMLEAPYRKETMTDGQSTGSPPLHHHQHGLNGRKRDNGRKRSRTPSRDKVDKDRDRGRSRDRDAAVAASQQQRDHRGRSRDKDRKDSDRDMKRRNSRERDRDRRGRRTSADRGGVVCGGGSGFGGEKRERRSRERRTSRSRDMPRRSKDGSRRHGSKEREPPRRIKSPHRSKRASPVPPPPSASSSLHNRHRHRSPPSTPPPPTRPFRRGRTPPNGLGDRSPPEDLSPEERDARTVFCMQLSQRIRARDLEEFFSSVGKVRDVRLITCNKTKRFKGIAYIEFKDPESVPLALGLSGQRLLGIPISVQHTQAEKNRMANAMPNLMPKNHVGPMRLYVGSLHFNITEDMLRGIFEPFGKIDSIQLIMDPETNRSKGYGFITFHNAEDAKKALEQLNGFELAGRPMKVGNVTERLDVNTNTSLDTDEMDRSGIDLGATGRLQLMFKLAEGAGLAVPQAAANALLATAPQPTPAAPIQPAPSIATQCFLLSNMFDPASETNPSWDTDITDDVIDECKKHGGVLHVYVDKTSQGNVYVKCPSIATAVLAVNSLHGRWFAGRVITAAYVPLVNYHSLFPDAMNSLPLLQTTRKS